MTLIVRSGFNGMTDADAIAYVNAVEAADEQLLEFGVGKAINDFVVGCKLDNTWSAIKASCILSGARKKEGAFIDLKTATQVLTNNGFADADYNRKTGLVGNGSSKYLNSNRNNNADPQDSNHQLVYVTTAHTAATAAGYIGAGAGSDTGATHLGANLSGTNEIFFRSRTSTGIAAGVASTTGVIGLSRSSAVSFNYRLAGTTASSATASQAPFNGNVLVFNRALATAFSNGRIAFYSIGESLDLALLDARVSALITAIGVAIP
jgi:hypothetical protein